MGCGDDASCDGTRLAFFAQLETFCFRYTSLSPSRSRTGKEISHALGRPGGAYGFFRFVCISKPCLEDGKIQKTKDEPNKAFCNHVCETFPIENVQVRCVHRTSPSWKGKTKEKFGGKDCPGELQASN